MTALKSLVVGTCLLVLQSTQPTAQPQPHQSAQPHMLSQNAGTDSVPNPQQNGPSIPPHDHNASSQAKAGKKTQQKKKIKKNTQASLKIASLNIRGRGPTGNNKWNHINQIMKEQRLGVLAIQEAHLTQEHVDNLHTLFGKRL
jgi:hypothetical protein